MTKKNKGYSLIEIAVGIIMLTIFLLVSIGLFNGCYNNYRRIKQRNIAIDRAVYYIENMLQTDSDVLTGFFVQTLDASTHKYSLKPSKTFSDFVSDDFTGNGEHTKNQYGIVDRYAKYKNMDVDDVELPLDADLEDFIFADRGYLVNQYIAYDVKENVPDVSLQRANGSYGIIVNDEVTGTSSRYAEEDKYTVEINNEIVGTDEYEYVTSNGGAFKVVKTISRIPISAGKAYGNNVLRLKVDVYYSRDFSNVLSEDNMDVITINTVKLST